MTREQALNYLKSSGFSKEQIQAIVEALSGVDAISRAEMLKYQQYLHGKMSNEENHKLREFIKELPSVTPRLSSEVEKNSKKLEKNFGELDCISREKAIAWAEYYIAVYDAETANESIMIMLNGLLPVTPQDIDYKAQYERLSQKAEIVISQLRADRDRLMSLASVTPQEPRWIPTSERLPNEDGEYYATVYDTDENYKYMDIAEFEDGIWQYKDYIKVLAWMPLPKPYKAESEDKDGSDD